MTGPHIVQDGVDRDIAELKSSVGDVKDDVDDKLIAAKDATAATLKTAAEAQDKLNRELKAELLAAVNGAADDAAEALASANGFKVTIPPPPTRLLTVYATAGDGHGFHPSLHSHLSNSMVVMG